LSWINWLATVYHGLPLELLSFNEQPADYLAFVGRMCPEKRVDLAIEIARLADRELKIAAKIDPKDGDYFHEEIEALLRQPHVTYVGEISEIEKQHFLGNAAATLFPIDWPEPFGLVMIESMACGTPVIAFRRGSVPEILDEGVTGFVCENAEQAAERVDQLARLSRRRCRDVFERRFSAPRMAQDYLSIYKRLIQSTARPAADGRSP
jgi:glycosyltransferase involved in cell wall biosynthesis